METALRKSEASEARAEGLRQALSLLQTESDGLRERMLERVSREAEVKMP